MGVLGAVREACTVHSALFDSSAFGERCQLSFSSECSGTAVNGAPSWSCCQSPTHCPMRDSRERLAQQLLEIALKYGLRGFTGDWEWDRVLGYGLI